MIVRAIEFGGNCGACNSGNGVECRPAVVIGLDHDDDDAYDGEWLCLRCAQKLADRLVKAIASAKAHHAAGHIYRGDKWRVGTRSVRPLPVPR